MFSIDVFLLSLSFICFEFLIVYSVFDYSFYASSLFLGALSFLPGGLGITEASFTGLLNLQGISLSMAIVIVIIVRLFTLWFGVGIGFIALKLVGGFSIKSTNS